MHNDNVFQKSFFRRLLPLLTAQTLGIFNDNAFKALLVFAALGLSNEYSHNAFFIALMTVIFVLPFIIFAVPAGFFPDRFSKKRVIAVSKFFEIVIMIIGTFFLLMIHQLGIYPVVCVLFCLASQASFFSPAFNSILPEIFTESEISRANGIIGLFNFLAVIFGFASGTLLKTLFNQHLYICGLIFLIIALLGYLGALRVTDTGISDFNARWNMNVFVEFWKNFQLLCKKKSVFVSSMGEAYFYAMGACVQSIVVLYGKFTLGLRNDIELGLLQVVIGIGMAIGCFLGGRLSRNKLELGISPIGAIGISIFLAIAVLYPGKSLIIILGQLFFVIYPFFISFLFVTSIFAGIFVIPLKVCQQERTLVSERGRILAFSNFLTFFSILISGIITYILTGKSEAKTVVSATAIISRLNDFMLNLSPGTVILILAFLTFIVCLCMYFCHREFVLRSASVLLTRTFYRVKSYGERNIPEHGPVLLFANHVSYIDNLLISSCFSRFINFVTYKDIYDNLFFRLFYRFCNAISFPLTGNAEDYNKYCEKVKSLLRNGEIVCIYPERKLTRSGLMGTIIDDLDDLLPNDIKVPVIPVYIGALWGSIFSLYHRETKTMLYPSSIPHYLEIGIGKDIGNTRGALKLREILSELYSEVNMFPKQHEKSLHFQFVCNAKLFPFRKLITDKDGKTLTSLKLLFASVLFSKIIRKRNDNNKYIGVLLPNCNAAIISILGIIISDKIPAILNYTWSKDSLDLAVERAELKTIITSRQFIQKVGIAKSEEMVFLEELIKNISIVKKLLNFLLIILTPSKSLIKILSPKSYNDVFKPAMLLFSSGSGGPPKGVLLSHHNFNSNVHSFAKIMGCRKDDKILGNLPLFHSYGMNICFWTPLMLGVQVVYVKNPLDATVAINAIKEHQLTLLMSTPTFLQIYMKKMAANDFKSLRLVILGAEKMRQDIAKKFYNLVGIEPVEGYGCTELSPVVAINVSGNISELGKKCGKLGSVGRPIPSVSVKAVNPETFEEVPADIDGLLLVKGPNVMIGYLGEPELTKNAIVDGWYNTGDMGKVDENGFITITGRNSRFSKISGEMVPHELVEAAIHEVLEAEHRLVAVAGVSDVDKGEKLIVFFDGSSEINPKEIVEKLKNKGLPNLWIPKADSFIKIDQIPLLGTGKLNLKKIRELALDKIED